MLPRKRDIFFNRISDSYRVVPETRKVSFEVQQDRHRAYAARHISHNRLTASSYSSSLLLPCFSNDPINPRYGSGELFLIATAALYDRSAASNRFNLSRANPRKTCLKTDASVRAFCKIIVHTRGNSVDRVPAMTSLWQQPAQDHDPTAIEWPWSRLFLQTCS